MILFFILGTQALVLNIRPVKAETIIVPDNYPTIQAAINAANNGDTVYVKSGVYQQLTDIEINKSISLIGQDEETTIISGVYWPPGTMITQGVNDFVVINADNVTIEGFTFLNGLDACVVYGSGCLISQNNFINNNDGVDLKADGNTVSNCFFNGTTDVSVVVFYTDNNTVTSNVIQKSYFAGIYVDGGSDNAVVGNEVYDCADFGTILDMFSVNNTVANNEIANCGFEDTPAPLNFWNSGIVLNVYSDSNQIVENNVSDNKIGLSQRYYSNNNSIYHNSFIDNQVQVKEVDGIPDCANLWDNGYPSGGNYWSNYGGTDSYHGPYQNMTGSDGIGDTPYVIDANNTDHYPLMLPSSSQITFDQTGVGSEFNGTVVTIDGANYSASSLPLYFWWEPGSVHSFSYAFSLSVSGGEQYFWNSTTGLSTLQSDSITVASSGIVTGDYVTHAVTVTNITASTTWVYQGGTPTINVTVKNVGAFNESAVSITLYYNVTAGKSINTYPLSLSAGQSLTLAFTWNTKGVPYQNYTLTAVATIPTGSNTLSDGTITIKLLGDVNGDGRVDLRDIALVARAFGSNPTSSNWNPYADINGDGTVNMKDIDLVARNFGQHYP